jgi:pimeloyl-ACP methyl ester carboxylesterase
VGARPVLASLALHPAGWNGAVILNPALKTKKDLRFLLHAFFSGAPFLRLGTFEIPLTVNDYTDNDATHKEWLNEEYLTTRCSNRFFGRTVKLRHYADRQLSQLKKPVLALLGGHDELVPQKSVESILKEANNPSLTIGTIPTGTHCMLIEKPADIAAKIEGWLPAAAPNVR